MNWNNHTSTKISYWIIRLKLSTLLRILFENKKGKVKRLTFIESGRLAHFAAEWLARWKVVSFTIHKIEPRRGVAGPVLHLSDVRDDRGAVITLDIYRHILEMRRKISSPLMASYESTLALLGGRSMSLVHAWIGLQVAEEIAPAVYLAHYGRWKYANSASSRNHRNVLILPHSNWSSFVGRNLTEAGLMDGVVSERHRLRETKNLIRLARYIMHSAMLSGFAALSRAGARIESGPNQNQKSGKKIMVNYSLGIDGDLRNDIPFLQSSDFDFSRLVICFKSPGNSPSVSELNWFKDNKIDYFVDPRISDTIRGVPELRPSGIFKKERVDLSRKYLKIVSGLVLSRKKYWRWILAKCWEMGIQMAFLKAFFISNNVGIYVHSVASGDNFISNLALSEAGGIAVDAERSISFDYCTYIHNSPCHVRFAAGPYSAAQIPEPSFSQHTLLSGASNNLGGSAGAEGIELNKNEDQIVLAVFDELPNDVFFGNSVEELYRAAFELVSSDNRFFLLIKTKKPRVMEKLPNVYKEIMRYGLEGRCLFLDWKTTVYAASSHADLVMSLPSTAVFESIVNGVPTIVYNPMRSGSSLLYRNRGLNRRIFEDSETMIAAVKAFAYGKNEKIGDCSDIVSEIDPFRDGLGAKRVGEYLKWCLEGLDREMSRDEILAEVNKAYASKWRIPAMAGCPSHTILRT